MIKLVLPTAFPWFKALHRVGLFFDYYVRHRVSPNGPTNLSVEITNHCNMHCRMCDHHLMVREPKMMEMELFRKIIDDAAALGIPTLGLSRFGEPTLHPDLPEMGRYAKAKGIRSISFATNASRLNENLCRALLETHAFDIIACSVDGGTKQTYEANRQGHGVTFENIVGNIEGLIKMRNSMGLTRPEIRIGVVMMANTAPELKTIIRQWKPLVNNISINPMNHVTLDQPQIDHRKSKMPCPLLAYTMAVYVDGTAGVCSNDNHATIQVGSLVNQSLLEIWNSPAFHEVRRIHFNKEFESLPICQKCIHTFHQYDLYKEYLYINKRSKD